MRYVVCTDVRLGCGVRDQGCCGSFVAEDSAAGNGWSRVRGVLGPAGPLALRIVGRHRHFINAFGENRSSKHINLRFAKAAAEISVAVGVHGCAVYPTPTTRPGLELAVEVPDSILAAWRVPRRHRVSRRWASRSSAERRCDQRTDDAGIARRPLRRWRETFHRWLRRGKLGGQHKCRGCKPRDIIEIVIGVACRGRRLTVACFVPNRGTGFDGEPSGMKQASKDSAMWFALRRAG